MHKILEELLNKADASEKQSVLASFAFYQLSIKNAKANEKAKNAKGDGYNPYRDSEGRFDDGLSIIEIKKMTSKGANQDKIAAARAKKKAEVEERKAKLEKMLKERIDEMTELNDTFGTDIQKVADEFKSRFKHGPVKKLDRVMDKVINDYNGDVTAIKDVVRGTIVVDNPDQMDAIKKRISETYEIHGEKRNFEGEGYQDGKITVYLDKEKSYIAEIQVMTPEMADAKKERGHKLYTEWRVIKDPNSEEAQRINQQIIDLYAVAKKKEQERINKQNS